TTRWAATSPRSSSAWHGRWPGSRTPPRAAPAGLAPWPARRSTAAATIATRCSGWTWRPRRAWANGSRRGCWATRCRALHEAAGETEPAADRVRGMGDNGRMETKLDRIRSALGAFNPVHLDVLDESHMHSRGL